MHPIGGKIRGGNVQHQVILYICLLHHLRVAGDRVPGPGLCHEHAETPPEAEAHLGLLKGKGPFPAQVIIDDDQAPVHVIPGV